MILFFAIWASDIEFPQECLANWPEIVLPLGAGGEEAPARVARKAGDQAETEYRRSTDARAA